MKFTMCVSLALVGVGVLFAQDGDANDVIIERSMGRRRRIQQQSDDAAVNRSNLERRLEKRSFEYNRSNKKRESSFAALYQQSLKVKQNEDDWLSELLLRAVGSMSMEPLPTAAPSQDSPPTPPPSVRPTRNPTETPTPEPTMNPTNDAATKTPTTDAPTPGIPETDSPTPGTPATDSPTPGTATPTNPTEIPATELPTRIPSASPTEEEPITDSPTPQDPTTDSPTLAPQATTTSPTGMPTGNPTSLPTRIPSAAPTGTTEDPTDDPTLSPTAQPTTVPVSPTDLPTIASTDAPTSIAPTMGPTSVCTVGVEVFCVWAEDGVTDCRDIPIPGACYAAEGIDLSIVQEPYPLSSITMLFDYSPCPTSLTLQKQPEEFVCVDQGEPSSTTDFDAQIVCVDDEMNTLVDSTVRPGQFILWQGQNSAGNLGSVVRCEISEVTTDGLRQLQELSITTSVLGNFYLSDRYGSLVVESCDAQKCVEPIQYIYNITNTQEEPRLISELLRDRNGDIVSLLPLLANEELQPGESTVVTEDAGLNVCFDGRFNTSVVAQASTPGEPTCRGSDEYSILVEVECRIDVDIVCMTESGEPCEPLVPSSDPCSQDGMPLQSLRFLYTGKSCAGIPANIQGGVATCEDFSAPMERVQVACSGTTGVDLANESGETDIGVGDTVRLSSASGALPNTVTCEIRSSTDPSEIHQVVSFDTSGTEDVSLRDQFGSLQVEACSTELGALDCKTTICLEYVIQNVGPNDARVVDLTRALGDETVQLLSLLPNTTLVSGGTTETVEKFTVDTCSVEESCVSTIVQTSGSNGLVCEDQDDFCFGGFDCTVGLDMTCQLIDTGLIGACTDLQGEQFPQCVCAECPSQLLFRYTANGCPEADVPGLLSCIDENPLPEERAFIIITGAGNELFRGAVDSGEEIEVSLGEGCLPEELMVVISAGESAASSQVTTLQTSCSEPGLTLLTTLGAMQFSGYSCAGEEVSHNCFVDAQFDFVATNTGAVSQSITTLSFSFGGQITDLLTDLPTEDLTLGPAETLATSASVTLERCVETEYLAVSTVQGNAGECEASAEITIGSIEPGTLPPTTVPPETPMPTVDPSLPITPTASPNPNPTVLPVIPTELPTIEPGTLPPTTMPPETPMPTVDPSLPITPTAFPTPNPTVLPVVPTESPTVSPTAPPATPTDAPSFVEDTPSPTPLSPGTSSPTSDCVLDVQTVCTPPPGSDSCEGIRSEPVLCESRPDSMIFLYNGGGCDNSFNAQSQSARCEDYNGGPPTEAGELTYVVITDVRGAGIVFHHGWYEVGDLITVTTPAGGDLEANHNITIYGSNETGPDSILQTLTYHSSCSDSASAESLFLKDRFGSMQVVGFSSVAQGEVSCFTSASIDINVGVLANVGGQPITLTSIESSYSSEPGGEGGLANFTSEISGQQITSESDPANAKLNLDLDLTVRRTYSVFTTVTGTTTDGRQCRGTNLFQFAAGQAPPALFPTVAPTQFPTRSLQPSPDPEVTPCELTAVLTCVVIKGGSNSCLGLRNPSDVTCTGEMRPSSLSFQYTGDRCPVNPQNYQCADTDINMGAAREAVFVEAKDGDRVVASGEVRLNDFISLPGSYGDQTMITLYTLLDDGTRGDPLQILNVPTGCIPDDDLTLLNQYGALELTSFTNAASGEQGIEAQIELIYAVENSGFQLTTVDSGLIIDAFDGGPIEVVENPFNLEAGAVTILFRNEQILNLRLKEQLGRTDTFFLSVQGTAVSNDILCPDTAQLSF